MWMLGKLSIRILPEHMESVSVGRVYKFSGLRQSYLFVLDTKQISGRALMGSKRCIMMEQGANELTTYKFEL